jgi:hypothetical protein
LEQRHGKLVSQRVVHLRRVNIGNLMVHSRMSINAGWDLRNTAMVQQRGHMVA